VNPQTLTTGFLATLKTSLDTNKHSIYDVVVIGAGPCGLYAGFLLGLHNLSYAILDSQGMFGGRLASVYPDKKIADIGGILPTKAIDIVKNLVTQMQLFPPSYTNLQSFVQKIEPVYSGGVQLWHTKDQNNHSIYSRCVLLSLGYGPYIPKKHPLEALEYWANTAQEKSVFYSITDLNSFTNKTVVVLGGGDSAIDWALELAAVAKQVFVLHRTDSFRAAPAMVEKMFGHSNITVYTNTELIGVLDTKGVFTGINIKTQLAPDNGETISFTEQTLLCQAVCIFFGAQSKPSLYKEWGLEVGSKIKVDYRMQTNLAGVFAIGDGIEYPGKQPLIASGFHEAAMATQFIRKYIQPNTNLDKIVHSTSMKVFN
jgi:thioredoxin reductase